MLLQSGALSGTGAKLEVYGSYAGCSSCILPHLADPVCVCFLQLDNILLHGDAPAILKLCDFGYSKDGETESDCKTACGTPEYMAPEVSIAHPVRMRSMLVFLVPVHSFCSMCCSSADATHLGQAVATRSP